MVTVASLLAVVGNVPYVRDMLRGTVKPHPYTWMVGSIVSATVLFGMLQKGAGIAAAPVAVSEFFTILIFLFSLKYGFRAITKTDKLFLAAALLGLVPWALTNDPTLSVVIAVAIDALAFAPTYRKTWKFPRTENPLLYTANILRHLVILFVLKQYNITTVLHSVVMVVLNITMAAIIVLRRQGIDSAVKRV